MMMMMMKNKVKEKIQIFLLLLQQIKTRIIHNCNKISKRLNQYQHNTNNMAKNQKMLVLKRKSSNYIKDNRRPKSNLKFNNNNHNSYKILLIQNNSK